MFGPPFSTQVVWKTLFQNRFSNTQFWNHLWPVFKQQNKGSQWQLGNYFENVKGPPGQVCLISSSHNYPTISTRRIPKSTWSAFFLNQTHIPNTYFCFLNTETCYLNYDSKHIFKKKKHYKHVFQQHFINHNFHIILNNNF